MSILLRISLEPDFLAILTSQHILFLALCRRLVIRLIKDLRGLSRVLLYFGAGMHNQALLDALKESFPQLFSKRDEDGTPIEKLDLEKIRMLVGDGNYTDKYGLRWENKPEKFDHDTVGKLPAFKRVETKCIRKHDDKPTHVLIQGDNYHALNVLGYTHEGAVDVIYIDPPYNTGNKDFRYNDRFVDKEDGYRHSKWLSFMEKRLRLAKGLLKPSGAVFISIDENEQAQLKLLGDEIFGETNFAGLFCWKKRSTGGQAKDGALIRQTEYILCYKQQTFKFRPIVLQAAREKWRDFRKSGGSWQRGFRPNQFYPLYVTEDGSVSLSQGIGAIPVYPQDQHGVDGFWQNGKEEAARKIEQRRLKGVKSKTGSYKIQFFESIEAENVGNFIDIPATGGSVGLSDMDLQFNNPKPLSLLAYLINIAAPSNSKILDFFAGSGTTAHAVMQLNAEDGGTRQCILVTNDEGEFKDDSGHKLEGGICTHVTYPRLSKVINGYTTPKGKDVLGLGENLEFFETAFQAYPESRNQMREFVRFSLAALCLKSNCHKPLETTKEWSVQAGPGKALFVLFDEFATSDAYTRLQQIEEPVDVYVFAYEPDDDNKDVLGTLPNVTVHEVPRPLLELFLRMRG